MTQHLSVSAPVSFASGVGGLHPAQPVQAYRSDREPGHKGSHPQRRLLSKKSPARPSDRWQRRRDHPETPPVPDSTRGVVSHAPQPAPGIWFAQSRLARAEGEGDRRIAIRPLDGLIRMPLLGKASTRGHAMAIVGYVDAKDPATERYGMNERMLNSREKRAQLWFGELLKEPGMMEALKRYVFRKHPSASVGDKFNDIRQMALLDAWRRIARAIAQGGKVQPGNEQDLDDLDAEGPRDVDLVICRAISKNDKAAFQSMAKTLIFNQIVYKGADLTRKERESVPTVPLVYEEVGVATPRRNETLGPIHYSEPDKRLGGKVDPQIDPDLSHPDTREDVEERENNQIKGQQLKESWLNWLKAIHDKAPNERHKRRLQACIELERLAFIDDGEVRINLRLQAPEDDDPYLYHAFLGRTHGARQELAKKNGVSLGYFEQELHRMRNEYWPAWVASVIEEMK